MKTNTYIGRIIDDETGERLVDIVGNADSRYGEDSQTYSTKRGPKEGNRVFTTLAHAQAYISDLLNTDGTIHEDGDEKTLCKSAFPGIILTVVNDSNTENNGAYLVINSDPNANPGLGLKRLDTQSSEIQEITEDQIEQLFSTTTPPWETPPSTETTSFKWNDEKI